MGQYAEVALVNLPLIGGTIADEVKDQPAGNGRFLKTFGRKLMVDVDVYLQPLLAEQLLIFLGQRSQCPSNGRLSDWCHDWFIVMLRFEKEELLYATRIATIPIDSDG